MACFARFRDVPVRASRTGASRLVIVDAPVRPPAFVGGASERVPARAVRAADAQEVAVHAAEDRERRPPEAAQSAFASPESAAGPASGASGARHPAIETTA